jgi:hypothetical protein
MTKVITYQSPCNETINLTPDQIRILQSALQWPSDRNGQEFCSVSHGLHEGQPTYTNTEIVENFIPLKEN